MTELNEEVIKALLRPIVEELLTNTFDVYKTVHQHEEKYFRDLIRQVMREPDQSRAQQEAKATSSMKHIQQATYEQIKKAYEAKLQQVQQKLQLHDEEKSWKATINRWL